jgi:ribonuclease Z
MFPTSPLLWRNLARNAKRSSSKAAAISDTPVVVKRVDKEKLPFRKEKLIFKKYLLPDRTPSGVSGVQLNIAKQYFTPRLVGRRTHPYVLGKLLLRIRENDHAAPEPGSKQTVSSGMLCAVDIATAPSADTPGACLRVHFDSRHYLFGNVSEGTQRIMASKRISMAKVENIFMSGLTDWHSNGGLLGFLLTIADVHETVSAAKEDRDKERLAKGLTLKAKAVTKPDQIKLHGGKNLTHLLATARRFVFRKSFPLRPQEIRSDPKQTRLSPEEHDWEDENIRVWYVPVESSESRSKPAPSKKRRIDSICDSDGEGATTRAKGEGKSSPTSTNINTSSQEDIDQQMRLCIVANMFDFSTQLEEGWMIDAFTERSLGDVKKGKTTYIRDGNGDLQIYRGPKDPEVKVLVRKDFKAWSAVDIPSLPPTEPARVSMCYIAKLQRGRGKFNPAKAIELGIEKKSFKLLTAGQSVTGKGGITVTPDMVLLPAPEPNGFAVVELPDASYVDGFLARPEWKNETVMNGIQAMYWIVREPDLLDDERLLSFMREHSTVKHIILSKSTDIGPYLIEGVAAETMRLTTIDDNLFPAVNHASGYPPPILHKDNTRPYEMGQAGERLYLNPKVKSSREQVLPPVPEKVVMERFDADPEILRLVQAAKTKITSPDFIAQMEEATKDIPNPDTEVIPLGTGSAIPSRSRNVSCTLVRVPGIGSYLFDCGENSLGQLRRLYGFDGADEVVRDLRAIWISHSHADHHLGTVSVIRRFSELVPTSSSPEQQQLAVIAHPIYQQFLTEYSSVEEIGLSTHIHQISDPPSSATLARFGISTLSVCQVDHCPDARAVALTLTSGLKIAYSGDCRPSATFASPAVGGGAHLLIHEATLDDELASDAVSKKHCTTSEALAVARAMRARNVLLTHFSQRYPKMPILGSDEEAGRDVRGGDDDMPVVFAFDFMRVRLGEFRRAREFLPALRRLYDDVKGEKEEEEKGSGGVEGVEAVVLEEKRADA